MNKEKTCDRRFDSECLKKQYDAINKRISLEFTKHNWLLKKIYNQTKTNKIPAIKKKKTFKNKKPTKKSLSITTVPMNFYKEQDSTAMNKANYREVTNCNKAVPIYPSHPNIGAVQRTNKQNVGRDLSQTMHNISNPQLRTTRYKRDDISIFPLCDPPKPIKHNLPIAIQPDRKSYVTCNQNMSKDTLTSRNLESGNFTASDNLFKKPERPVAASTNYRNILSSESARHGSIRNPPPLNNEPSKILSEETADQNDKPINLSNDNNRPLQRQNASTVDYENNLNKNIKIDEETLKIILALSKENKNLIIETYMSSITDVFNQAQKNIETDRNIILKEAKMISEIFQIIADTVRKSLQQMYSNKSTQTVIKNRLEYTSLLSTSAIQNAANNVTIDRNTDFNHLQQQQRNQQNYQVYQQQRLRNQNNLPVDKTNDALNCKNQSQKDFKQGCDTVPIRYQTQNIPTHNSSHMQQCTPQSGTMNEATNYQQNYNRMNNVQKERVQIQQYRNQNSLNMEQQRYENRVTSEFTKTNPNDRINRNNMPSVIDKEFETVYVPNEREFLQHPMTNDTESQKRKSPYARDDLSIFPEGPKPIKHNTIPVSEMPKRQRYEDVSNNSIGLKDTSTTLKYQHKTYAENTPSENISKESEVTEIPSKNVISSQGDKDKESNECYIVDDDGDKRLTINEDSYNALFSLSQRNKNFLMKNYVSHISEMDKTTQKYGDNNEILLENESNKIAHVFKEIIVKIAKSYKTNKPQFKAQMIHKYVQTVMQNETENVSDKVDSPIIKVNTMQNPLNNETYKENEENHISLVQQPREMYGHQPSNQVLHQYRNPSNQNLLNQNQGQVRPHKAISNVSNAPFFNQMDPRLNRQRMTIPMEHQRSYVLPTSANINSLPLQVQQRPFQYGNVNQHWNYEHNNHRWINNDPTQMDQFQQYQARMMMHQQNVEQQRYYQMELQRNAWAAQTGNYPRNDWT